MSPFADGGVKWPVSRNGGQDPRWGKDGNELFYVEGTALMSVAVATNPEFSAGQATRLFVAASSGRGNYPNYDVSPDGRRFLTAEDVESESLEIHIVENWFAKFRDREDAGP